MQCVDDREDEEIKDKEDEGNEWVLLTRSCHLPLLSKLSIHPSVFLNITTPLFFQSKFTIGQSVKEVTEEWRVESEWRVSTIFCLI